MDDVRISVVICTIERSGREVRLAQVIRELQQQQHVKLDIILVWQGKNLSCVPEFPDVRVLVVDLCSSAESRNCGADIAKHDLIAFYDDDTFPCGREMLWRAVQVLNERQLDFLTCNIASSGKIMSSVAAKRDVVLDRYALMAHMWEPGLLVRRAAFQATRFDQTLGIGCIHGSSEGFDFGFRLLANGFHGQRIASLLIDHPPLPSNRKVQTERFFFYSLGGSATMIQHHYYGVYLWTLIKAILRMGFSAIACDWNRVKISWIKLLCMMIGPLLPRRPARLLPLNYVFQPSFTIAGKDSLEIENKGKNA